MDVSGSGVTVGVVCELGSEVGSVSVATSKCAGFKRYCILATCDVDGEILVSTFNHGVGAIIWGLNRLADRITTDENMSTG